MKVFTPARVRAIRRTLGTWYRLNKRDLPWRQTRDPYRIWISEIMLQQTRVAAVIPYYQRFFQQFPSIAALAEASDDALLSAWAGLGYYSRARNLRAAARKIVEAGAFPATFDDILALPGVGPYTAAAIASICFDAPHAVLDGNVMRVLARLTRNKGDILSSRTRAALQESAQTLLDAGSPAEHNQAMMELGAVICTPRDPACEECPLLKYCLARVAGLESELPIKGRRAEIRRVRRSLLVAIRNGNILLWQRAQDAAMLGGFWELPEPHQLPEAKTAKLLHKFSHAITNHVYDFHVMAVRVSQEPSTLQWTPLNQLSALPLSTVTRKALLALRVLPYDTT
ncbi:MAG: A/G-specific adenine glycosylase [Acidobacteria bacterium]|nr:A/G-specific adenine glycosylase [Acidobacteriota bacterium]